MVEQVRELDRKRLAIAARLRQMGCGDLLSEDIARALSEAVDRAKCTDDERQSLRDWLAQELPKLVGTADETVAWMLEKVREP